MTVAAIAGPFRGTVGAGVAGGAVDELEELSDETGGLELVEQLDPGTEAIEGDLFNGVAVEFVLGDKFQDEFLLKLFFYVLFFDCLGLKHLYSEDSFIEGSNIYILLLKLKLFE